MKTLSRIGISLPPDLLKAFDQLRGRSGARNRSEAVRDIVRDRLVREAAAGSRGLMFGVLSFVYDHHTRDLDRRLNDYQHRHVTSIVSTTHVHIDRTHCLEVIILKGTSARLRAIGDQVLAVKGVKHGDLFLTQVDPTRGSGHTHTHSHDHGHHRHSHPLRRSRRR
ncbi:MAG: nickel-responsive transcriptional regulator NikR [Bacteroidetes bacterium]|jgi:CopG family nickel-responsive transcriptional regulator|nr:nickel-responsive transcriptional regulator NikR [Bacteroidota bacterium]